LRNSISLATARNVCGSVDGPGATDWTTRGAAGDTASMRIASWIACTASVSCGPSISQRASSHTSLQGARTTRRPSGALPCQCGPATRTCSGPSPSRRLPSIAKLLVKMSISATDQ
jgi:hypothetical protein